MNHKAFLTLLLFFTFMHSKAQDMKSDSVISSDPFAHTYSIVARDSVTGEIGVAVQSHWFSVGSVVAWGEAGVGVVATQSFVNVSFGIRGLELLKKGKNPQQAVSELLSDDPAKDVRQLAILNIKGEVATHTGTKCIADAGHITGKNFSVQANMMLNDKVWGAMSKAFENTKGPLAERMMAALEAGQATGGDIRGKQSAAMMVFKGVPSGKPWEDKLIDLRVEDHSEPVQELKRLLKVYRAYEHMNNGDLASEKGDFNKALDEYSAAEKMFPDNLEMKFWHAVMLSNIGKTKESLPLFKVVFLKDKNWKTLFGRLPKSGLLNLKEEEMKMILECDKK